PNFIKAAPVIAAIGARSIPQRVVHTGQHYDERMSDVFFDELGLPVPDVNLGVGSGSHARQTAALLTGLEDELLARRPALVVVYGDVNSTLAAALVAAKLHVPVAHVEAGLRSFDATMPEEINRRVTDSLSSLLFVTSPEGIAHLAREGAAADAVHLVGNPMIDTLLDNLERFDPAPARAALDIGVRYAVSTLHRPANVDDPATARALVAALGEVGVMLPVVLPLHPRGRESLRRAGIERAPGVRIVDPLGYVEFLSLVRGASLVLTDSGGIQEETTMLDVPCLTIRPNTERPITITHGTNQLVAPGEVAKQAAAVLDGSTRFPTQRPPLWDGHAGERIAAIVHDIHG
ncbi:MAG TPA: UDP-N-acetylglucosamine 2-epimerase (non-hydrolyzing), partial [Euzebyales bacterium]|nr:UDP-N-acetylglucosamine 2-epimerase (non-hydrolyzing) [Euzebyales bacterium]